MTAARWPEIDPDTFEDERVIADADPANWTPPETREYRVLLADRETHIRFWVNVPRAMGPNDARNQVGVDYPDCEVAEVGERFHDACRYEWAIHDNRRPDYVSPFGCPPDETTAAMEWAR